MRYTYHNEGAGHVKLVWVYKSGSLQTTPCFQRIYSNGNGTPDGYLHCKFSYTGKPLAATAMLWCSSPVPLYDRTRLLGRLVVQESRKHFPMAMVGWNWATRVPARNVELFSPFREQ